MAKTIPGTAVPKPAPTKERRQIAALMVAWWVLIAYAASNSKQPVGQKRAAIAGAIVVGLVIFLVGEFNQELALGFAGLLVVSMLVAGPSNVLGYILKTLPTNFIQQSGG